MAGRPLDAGPRPHDPGAVEPIVDLDPGARDNTAAVAIAEGVRRAIATSAARRVDFGALRGSVAVVVEDAGRSLTLRFDHGRLTVHEGMVGVPDVTLRTTERALDDLRALPVDAPLRRLLRGGVRELRAVRAFAGALARDEAKLYGAVRHPRMVLRVLRLLTARP